MTPTLLVEQATGALPAPWWFIQFFKVLGFTLHAVLMHLWYAGLLWAMYWAVRRGGVGREAAARLIRQMPLLVALGINLGIVPLLFLQVAYPKVFYPATIYMAWFWLGIVVLLIPAYYGVYIYSFGLSQKAPGDDSLAQRPRPGNPDSPIPQVGNSGYLPKPKESATDPPSEQPPDPPTPAQTRAPLPSMSAGRLLAGWASALLFLLIGFFFVNGLTLMTRQHLFLQEKWQAVWGPHTVAGAALGTGLNLDDPRLWPRWLMFFSLAWTTLAVWLVVDTAWRSGHLSELYQSWIIRSSWKLYLAGMVGFVLFGCWYLHSWTPEVRTAMFSWPIVVLTVLTAVSPGPVWLAMVWFARQSQRPSRALANILAGGQLLVLALNATSRQLVQNLELAPFFPVWQQTKSIQWSPLMVFVLLFILGAAVLLWMIAQLWRYGQPRGPFCCWQKR